MINLFQVGSKVKYVHDRFAVPEKDMLSNYRIIFFGLINDPSIFSDVHELYMKNSLYNESLELNKVFLDLQKISKKNMCGLIQATHDMTLNHNEINLNDKYLKLLLS